MNSPLTYLSQAVWHLEFWSEPVPQLLTPYCSAWLVWGRSFDKYPVFQNWLGFQTQSQICSLKRDTSIRLRRIGGVTQKHLLYFHLQCYQQRDLDTYCDLSKSNACSTKKSILFITSKTISRWVTHDIIRPLLILVTRASPDLHFRSVGINTTRNIQTFVSIDFDTSALENPFLRGSTSTTLKGHSCAVGFGRGSHAFAWGKRILMFSVMDYIGATHHYRGC